MTRLGAFVIAVLVLGSGATSVQAQSTPRVIQVQLDTVAHTFSLKGYRRDASNYGSQVIGALDDDGEVQIQVTLRAGGQYVIAAGCDADCSDMDLSVISGSTVVASDLLEDDVPMVTFTAPTTGAYMLKISMVACSANPCAFGFTVLSK